FPPCAPSGSTRNSDYRRRNCNLGIRRRHDESYGSDRKYVWRVDFPHPQPLAVISYEYRRRQFQSNVISPALGIGTDYNAHFVERPNGSRAATVSRTAFVGLKWWVEVNCQI